MQTQSQAVHVFWNSIMCAMLKTFLWPLFTLTMVMKMYVLLSNLYQSLDTGKAKTFVPEIPFDFCCQSFQTKPLRHWDTSVWFFSHFLTIHSHCRQIINSGQTLQCNAWLKDCDLTVSPVLSFPSSHHHHHSYHCRKFQPFHEVLLPSPALPVSTDNIVILGMYQISGSGWPDIPPFFAIRFRQK